MVAKMNNKLYSIYDAETAYAIGEIKYQKALPEKKGGYFVYKNPKEALFASIVDHVGGNFTAPRTVLKCICWGTPLEYGRKLCFSFILPVNDLGLPMGYRSNPRECIQEIREAKRKRQDKKMEDKYDLNLLRMNN
mmetsp:Transcript_15241/g.23522  ORF Transcript_15241/g.23522 Transcript_15241/m.23522 type:complete len:135 (+) Transcript_15241:373-777(+)